MIARDRAARADPRRLETYPLLPVFNKMAPQVKKRDGKEEEHVVQHREPAAHALSQLDDTPDIDGSRI